MRFVIALALSVILAMPAWGANFDAGYPDLVTDQFKRLRNRDLDLSHPLTVKDKTLVRGDMTIHLIDGVFFPHQIVDGRVYGGVYLGSGEATFHIREKSNQEVFQRRTKDQNFGTRTFDRALLEFDDGTFAELFPDMVRMPSPDEEADEEEGEEAAPEMAGTTWAGYSKVGSDRGVAIFEEETTVTAFKTDDEKEAEKLFKGYAQHMRDFVGHQADILITQNLVEGQSGDIFAIEMSLNEGFKRGKDWVTFTLNVPPYGVNFHEEQLLFRHWPFPTNPDQQDWDLLAAQHMPDEYETLQARQREYAAWSDLDVEHYLMDLELYEDKTEAKFGIKANVTLRFRALEDSNSVKFNLVSTTERGENESLDPMRLQIRSITTPAGRPVYFVHNQGQLLVQLPETLRRGQTYELVFKYQGLVIRAYTQTPVEGSVGTTMYGLLNYAWFPQNGWEDRYTWDATMRTPNTIYAAISGTVRDFTEDKARRMNISRSIEDVSSPFLAIIMGKYQFKRGEAAPDEYPVTVFSFPQYSKAAADFITQTQGIITFYERLFGPYPYAELDIAQMGFGFGFGQAPSGFVQLTGEAYMSKTELASRNSGGNVNFRDAFLAHEIAHQWWGHKIGWQTYRDQWVSETLAEYSSALYVRHHLGDEAFQGQVRGWKGWAMNNKKTVASWAGAYVTEGREWTATAYNRGPLIMHAIHEAVGEDFIKALRLWQDWINSGSSATEDLRLVLEYVTAKDWSSFFDTYIYANGSIKDLVNDPIGAIDYANMPAAPEREAGIREEVAAGGDPAMDAPKPDLDQATEVFDIFVANQVKPDERGWTLADITTAMNPDGTMRSICQYGMSQALGQQIFLCAANYAYENGGSDKIVECQGLVDPFSYSVLDKMPDGSAAAWCQEK
jgi:hypothetical protein